MVRQVRHWAGLASWRNPPAVATVVAKRASKPATPPGLGVAFRGDGIQLSRQRVQTHSPTKATRIAWTPKCSWAGRNIKPGGIVTAWPPAGSFRSQNSSDQDISASPNLGPDVGLCLPHHAAAEVRPKPSESDDVQVDAVAGDQQ